MNILLEHIVDDQNGITYTRVGDCYLPDLLPPEEPHYVIGRFGRMRLDYLKNSRKVEYNNLLTSGKLISHLQEIDETAQERFEFISKQISMSEGVTEQLKAENQILWVMKMNSIYNRVEEMIRDELIYT